MPGNLCYGMCQLCTGYKRFRMDDTHRNFPRSGTKTTFWSALAAKQVATVLGKTRRPSVGSQRGNYASSPPVGAADHPQQQQWRSLLGTPSKHIVRKGTRVHFARPVLQLQLRK